MRNAENDFGITGLFNKIRTSRSAHQGGRPSNKPRTTAQRQTESHAKPSEHITSRGPGVPAKAVWVPTNSTGHDSAGDRVSPGVGMNSEEFFGTERPGTRRISGATHGFGSRRSLVQIQSPREQVLEPIRGRLDASKTEPKISLVTGRSR
jgi:hypothetical protein